MYPNEADDTWVNGSGVQRSGEWGEGGSNGGCGPRHPQAWSDGKCYLERLALHPLYKNKDPKLPIQIHIVQ